MGQPTWNRDRAGPGRLVLLLVAATVAGSLFSAVHYPNAYERAGSSISVTAWPCHRTSNSNRTLPASKEALQALQDIIRQGNCGKSPQGRRHRSLICTIVRNDLHLREFIVRHLLVGFCHIVIYDNNQVLKGRDHNISAVVAPFVQLGVVTHVPYMQDVTGLLSEKDKDAHLADCLRRVGNQADWVASLDSDEYLYIAKNRSSPKAAAMTRHTPQQPARQQRFNPPPHDEAPTSVGILDKFLHNLEHQPVSKDACALSMPWRMMYGEHRVLKSDKLLLDAYPRVCFTSKLPKLMFRPHYTDLRPPHRAQCAPHKAMPTDNSSLPKELLQAKYSRVFSVDEPTFQQALPGYRVHLVHYYSRSIEEYVLKSEQSIPPYFRLVHQSYDAATSCELWKMPHDNQYVAAVRNGMDALRASQTVSSGSKLPRDKLAFKAKLAVETQSSCPKEAGRLESDAGRLLRLPPEYKPLSRSDYALYVFLKLRIAQQHEWDEGAYLAKNPAAIDGIKQKKVVDGLHHFVTVGFQGKSTSCWQDALGKGFCMDY